MSRRDIPIQRRAGSRLENRRVLIVCEGRKTEHIYFEGIRKVFRLPTANIKVLGLGVDPVRLVQVAAADRSGYDEVWSVFDVEAPQPHAGLAEALALAAKERVRCAISNPCFEVWLVLHFREQNAYVDNDAIQRALTRLGCGYAPDRKVIDFAQLWPKHDEALGRAASLDVRMRGEHRHERDRNPWTSVHDLVVELVQMGASST